MERAIDKSSTCVGAAEAPLAGFKNLLLLMWDGKYGDLIRLSPGFAKKLLSDWKLDLLALCQFKCSYCSSNEGRFLISNAKKIYAWSLEQLGVGLKPPKDTDKVFIAYPGAEEKIIDQCRRAGKTFGRGLVLQFGMLVDNFSPYLVLNGTTFRVLKYLLENTEFTIRILTKSSLVAKREFIDLFKAFPGRVTVGMSCGSIDDGTMRLVEKGTTLPSGRVTAIRRLQEAGIRTFGMFCPVHPGFHSYESIKALYAAFGPAILEQVWAEPYNDRGNWKYVAEQIPVGTLRDEFVATMTDRRVWAKYAIELAQNHHRALKELGHSGDGIFLLYQSGMNATEIASVKGIPGVLFQS